MEQLGYSVLFDLGAYNAESADSSCTACADIRYSGNVVKVDPLTVLAGNYALCSEYHAVLLFVSEGFKCGSYLLSRVAFRSLNAPACKYFISMVVVMMIVVVAAAGAVRTVVVVMMFMLVLVIMVVVVMMFVLVLVIMVMVVMMFVLVLIIMVMVMMMLMLVLVIMIIVVMMFVFVLVIMVMVMMMLMLSLFKKSLQLIIESVLLSHSVNKLLTCELIPLSCNDRSNGIELLEASYYLVYLFS